jgi:hypothetical protein
MKNREMIPYGRYTKLAHVLLLVLGLLALALLAAGGLTLAHAGAATIGVEFVDGGNEAADLSKYTVYYSTTSRGASTTWQAQSIDIPMSVLTGQEHPSYETTINIMSPDNQVTRWYFSMKAFDTLDRPSDWSPEVPADINFVGPAAPEIIDIFIIINGHKVKITVTPAP